MRQNRFRLGLCPGPHWGSLQHSLDLRLMGRGLHCLVTQTPSKINASDGLRCRVNCLLGDEPCSLP